MSADNQYLKQITGHVIAPAGGVTKGVAVDRDGAVVTSGVPFGIALDDAEEGRPVAVIRQGIAPILSSDNSLAKDAGAKPTTGGKFIDDADTGTTVAIPQAASSAADQLIDAYVDCLNVNNA